ncbi:MAG: TfoX/Sxy family DNA transformation protein [bacterium]|nr:TfoX/Sxy family DNA transformation protein [bacterium]
MSDKRQLKDLRSVGPAMLEDFQKLGITSVAQLKSKNAQKLYDQLCKIAGQRMDPCVLDVFSCAIAQAKDPQLPAEQTDWWFWSKIRKQRKH